jgi:glycosyltransferase involved in cell wall biosynthesis
VERIGNAELEIVQPAGYAHGERGNPLSLAFLPRLKQSDVVHCLAWNTLSTDLAVAYGRLTQRPVFVTDVGGGARRTLQRWLPIGDWVREFLLIAEVAREQFARFSAKTRIIYAGVDLELFHPGTEQRRGVIFVGRLLPHKGIDYLIRAVDPTVPLTIVGRPYMERYSELCRELAAGKNVRFVTDATDAEVAQLLRSAEVAVLPSVYTTVFGDRNGLPELLGFAAMEAMASGTATICTRVGGLPELVVDGESGFLVPPNDSDALGERIRQILRDPAMGRALGRAGRERIEARFSWPAVAARCIEAYESAIERAHAHA